MSIKWKNWDLEIPNVTLNLELTSADESDFAIDLGGKSENRVKYVYMFSLIAFFILLIANPVDCLRYE